jgi:hypothetical protein
LMSDLIAILSSEFPRRLNASKDRYAFRSLVPDESQAIEARIDEQRLAFVLPSKTGAVVLPDIKHTLEATEEYANLVGFAVSLLASSGYVFVRAIAVLSGEKCIDVVVLPAPIIAPPTPVFSSKLSAKGVIEWIQRCEKAFKAYQAWLHVTATRYNR